MLPENIKILIQIKINLINHCGFLKLLIIVRDSHCVYLPQAQKSLARPLYIRLAIVRKRSCPNFSDIGTFTWRNNRSSICICLL